MKTILSGVLAATALLLTTGCGAKAPRQHEAAGQMSTSLPAWVLEPQVAGYLAGVGYAKPKKANPAYRRRIAMMRARAEIAKAVELFVTTHLTTKKTCTDEACRAEMKSRSQHLSRQLIGDVTVKDEWIDPQSGTLYIRLITKQTTGE